MAWLNRFLPMGKRRPGQTRPPAESKDKLVVGDSAFLKVSSSSYRSLLRTAVSDAERIAASIKDKARGEAEAEAARIVAQARLEVQEIKGKAEITAREEAQNIVSAAEKEAANIEIEAREKAFQFLVQTSQTVEKEIREEYRLALARLSTHLQELSLESQKTDAELKSKLDGLAVNQPWALKDAGTGLLSTPAASVSSLETSGAEAIETQNMAKPSVLAEEKTAEAAPLPEQTAGKRGKKFRSLKVKIPWRRASPSIKGSPSVNIEEEPPVEPAVSPGPALEVTSLERIEPPASILEQPIIPHPVAVAQEGHWERHAGKQKEVAEHEVPTLLEVDSQALYTGEVELTIIPPVELKLVSQLYNHLQTVPDIKVLYTRGSWDQGTTIVVVLEKPFALIKTITGIPGIVATVGLQEKATGRATLARRKDRGAKRLGVTLRETAGIQGTGAGEL